LIQQPPGLDNINDIGTASLRWKDLYLAGTVTTSGLQGTGIVNADNIADGTIATADLADNAITSTKITDGTIVGGDMDSTTDLAINGLTVGGGTQASKLLFGTCEITYSTGFATEITYTDTCSAPGVTSSSKVLVTLSESSLLLVNYTVPGANQISISSYYPYAMGVGPGVRTYTYTWIAFE